MVCLHPADGHSICYCVPAPCRRASASAPESRRCFTACASGAHGEHCGAPVRSVVHVLDPGSTIPRPATQFPVCKSLSAAEDPDAPVTHINNTLATHYQHGAWGL